MPHRQHPDESLTLTTAFLAAGATAIIGTRWPVDDDTATALSLRLYYHLQMGEPPAEALRHVQLDLLRPDPGMWKPLGRHIALIGESRLSHPVSWAGYVHHGIRPRKEGACHHDRRAQPPTGTDAAVASQPSAHPGGLSRPGPDLPGGSVPHSLVIEQGLQRPVDDRQPLPDAGQLRLDAVKGGFPRQQARGREPRD
jgi:CHAT domain